MIYPNGGRYKGVWNQGKLLQGNYEFEDGLEFKDPNRWDYCTYKDRRFYHEIIYGVEHPEIDKYTDKLFKNIPEGTYDTGDGYYDPEKGTIFNYDNKFIRLPHEEEVRKLF